MQSWHGSHVHDPRQEVTGQNEKWPINVFTHVEKNGMQSNLQPLMHYPWMLKISFPFKVTKSKVIFSWWKWFAESLVMIISQLQARNKSGCVLLFYFVPLTFWNKVCSVKGSTRHITFPNTTVYQAIPSMNCGSLMHFTCNCFTGKLLQCTLGTNHRLMEGWGLVSWCWETRGKIKWRPLNVIISVLLTEAWPDC